MITLNCIYSETGLFNRVNFHHGVNIILGKYPDKQNVDDKRSVNGVGKSTLVRLIDFALLSSTDKLNPQKYTFLQDHNVVLQFKANGISYQIKRFFKNPNMAYFGKEDDMLVDYPIRELRDILGDMFFMPTNYTAGYCTNKWFRTLLGFFISDDLKQYERNDPIDFVGYPKKKAELLAYNFYLLGLPNEHIYDLAETRDQMQDKQKLAKDLEKSIERETGKPISEVRTELAAFRERITLLESNLQEFEFIENYKDVENKLEEIAREMSDLLKVYHGYSQTLEHYQDSYKVEIEVDIAQIENLYQDIDRELAKFVRKTLDEVIQFRQQIATNRRTFLLAREKQLKETIAIVLDDISNLEQKRKKLYRLLQEEGAFDSIRHNYEQLIEEKVNLERNNAKIVQMAELEMRISALRTRASELANMIIEDIQKSEQQINLLRLIYKEILENAIFVDSSTTRGSLDISKYPDREIPTGIVVSVPQSESLGKHRFSLLAYALTVFLNLIRNELPLPHFLIHDGVFHSIARKTVVNVLNFVYHESLLNPKFQYIVTGNDDEFYIPPSEEVLYGRYDFDFDKHVIARYETTPEKKIFKREFG